MEAALQLESPAGEVRERLVGFVAETAADLSLARQRENALLYVRGLIEQGGRKSLQPTLFRLEETPARYESVQQFLADSPWEPELVVRACAERVAPELGVLAWVVDDTGIVKDGKHSPGVKRQYSGTLGKIGNCQIAVSVHAVGERGTLPLGWALYLPEEWCADRERRRKAKIPERVVFQTKPQLAAALAERASGWEVSAAPILADCAYGDDTAFRTRLHALEREYVLAVSAQGTLRAGGRPWVIGARAAAAKSGERRGLGGSVPPPAADDLLVLALLGIATPAAECRPDGSARRRRRPRRSAVVAGWRQRLGVDDWVSGRPGGRELDERERGR